MLDSSKEGAKKPKKSSSKQKQDLSKSPEGEPGARGNRLNMSAITGQNTG